MGLQVLTILLNYGSVTLNNCLIVYIILTSYLYIMMSHIVIIYLLLDEIESDIEHLDKNESCGLDGMYAEHIMYCSRRVVPLLAICISTFFGFLPDCMLFVLLVLVSNINVEKSMIVTTTGRLHQPASYIK